MEKISIIIPAHNEEKRIGRTLEKYIEFFSKLKKDKIIDFEMIIVINACKDNTKAVIEKNKIKEMKILEFIRGGKGFAIIEGFKEALKGNADLIGYVDADMSTSPEEYFKLVKNINSYDGMLASRYIKGAVMRPEQPMQRILASRVFNFLVRVLFLMNFRDTQCGAKVFKRKVIEKIVPKLGMTLWAFDVDLLYKTKTLKFDIREYPTYWIDDKNSHIDLKKNSIQMFFAIAQLRVINSRWKRILRPVKIPVGLLWRLLR